MAKGFRLFDKVKCFGKKCCGKEGFIMGRYQDRVLMLKPLMVSIYQNQSPIKNLSLFKSEKHF